MLTELQYLAIFRSSISLHKHLEMKFGLFNRRSDNNCAILNFSFNL